MKKVGRPKGSVKPKTVSFHRRVRPELAKLLDEIIFQYKQDIKESEKETIEKIKTSLNVFTNKDI